jgi:uncharacterized protein YciI
MQPFVYRLLPPRPDFMTTMTDDERATMTAHVAYWSGLMGAGRVVGFGPVAAGYGIGLVLAEDLADAEALRDADPAIRSPHGLRGDIEPMVQLVTPGGVYPSAG